MLGSGVEAFTTEWLEHMAVLFPVDFHSTPLPFKPKEKAMKTGMFPKLNSALNAAGNLPLQISESAYHIKATGNKINASLKTIALLLLGILTVLVLTRSF